MTAVAAAAQARVSRSQKIKDVTKKMSGNKKDPIKLQEEDPLIESKEVKRD